MRNTLLKNFLTVAVAEGVSYLILLLIAMPLKYWGNFPHAVQYVGWAHGVLFVAFMVLLLLVWIKYKWSF
jgi:integral membrane protein